MTAFSQPIPCRLLPLAAALWAALACMQAAAQSPAVPSTAPQAPSVGSSVNTNTTNSIANFPISTSENTSKNLQNSSAQDAGRLIPFDVRINSAPAGTWPLLERAGALYATAEAFEEWRVNRRPEVPAVQFKGQTWYPLSSVPGFEFKLNLADQSIDLVFASNAFAATRLATDAQVTPVVTSNEPAFFVNLDANYNQTQISGIDTSRDLGALAELGFSNRWGVLTSSHVGRNLTSNSSNNSAAGRSWRRLETTFSRDFTEQKLTLRLGDSSTRGGVGARSVYFGGVQITRNFALSPGFLTQPIPVIQGTSSAPSTVELYINDVLRQTSNVPTGPFAISNFPLLTGSGQARVVVRDVLGRETVVVQPFFSHSALLEQGLGDWSLEAGAVRENLGTENADYGQRFASGLLRYGLTKQTTLEVSSQLGRNTQTLGASINQALPLGLFGYASLAASRNRDAANSTVAGGTPSPANGREWSLGLEHNSLRHGLSGRWVGASRGYRQLGLQSGTLPTKLESSLNYTYSAERFGSVGVGAARIDTFDSGRLTTLSANYSIRIGERASLSISASRVMGTSKGTSVGLNLNIPLGNSITSSSSVNHRSGGQTDAYTSVSQGLTSDSGTGWRALAGSRAGQGYGEAGVYHQNDKALLSADTSASRGQTSVRLGMQTALVWIGGKVFSSRRVQDGFALVEVPGYADVGVGFQGNSSTRTDSSGVAFLPRLQAYQRNSIRLNPTELPINAELDTIEQIAVPASRSGVRVTFPVRSGRAALIKIIMPNGTEAPAGTEVELAGDSKEFFVARRGEAFITGLQANNTLLLKIAGSPCKVEVTMPTTNKPDEIVRLGPLVCRGVKP
jgi:outer membrane usher protein